MKKKTAALLVNTGSPDSFHPEDIKKYLNDFLMDERVIDIEEWKRKILVKGIIVPFRSKKSAALYENIWTSEGSPLIAISEKIAQKVSKATGLLVYSAMRYGNPSILASLRDMEHKGIENVILLPMFPQYAMSTYESIVEETKLEVKKLAFENLKIIPPFFDHPSFINALSGNAKVLKDKKYDAVIISYHSLPIRHILKADKNNDHCLKAENCCQGKHKVHEVCYRAQTFATTNLLKKSLGLSTSKTYHTYQSAMSKKKWLGPDTEETLIELARKGKKNVAVICPGFTVDNLETLEEINIRGRKAFMENGGESFTHIPALNQNSEWIKIISKWILDEAKKIK